MTRRWRPSDGPKAACSITECTAVRFGRQDWCLNHYNRWKRTGDPLGSRAQDPLERFWKRVDKDSDPCGCWLWTGSRTTAGYGVFKMDGVRHLVHRWAYERLVGPIPDGLVLDHVWLRGCRHRNCVNPAHLEPVTMTENARRTRRLPHRVLGG